MRVVVADDHPIVRSGLSALIGSLADLELVGVAANGKEAVRQVVLTKPDVALLDLDMPELDGYAATREIVRTSPQTAVLVLTMSADDDAVFAAVRAGARGYLVKGAEQEDILRAVRGVAAGEVVFGPGVAERVLAFLSSPPDAPDLVFPELTRRERQILDLIAAGRSNAEIGRSLGYAAKTIANNVSRIFAKLQVADRTQAMIRARDAGLGREPA
ncbi:response regulator transcription factor [Knoellia locipacati]|uniref:response regulator n=1 Tax=Knoellia locipacati TaxID=882824 RepID=UPI00384C956A